MLRKLSIFLFVFTLIFTLNFKVFAANDWDVSKELSLVKAVQVAQDVVKEKYPEAAAYKVTLKFPKRGGAYYEVQLKVSDNKCIKVRSYLSGKTKLYDKKGKFYNVTKSSIKDESLRGKKHKKRRKSKSKRRRSHRRRKKRNVEEASME